MVPLSHNRLDPETESSGMDLTHATEERSPSPAQAEDTGPNFPDVVTGRSVPLPYTSNRIRDRNEQSGNNDINNNNMPRDDR